MNAFNHKLRKHHQEVAAGELGEMVEKQVKVEQDRQDSIEEQTPLILIEELQAEMRNLRAEVHNLTDVIAANNLDGETSRTLSSPDIYQDNPINCENPFIPEGDDDGEDTTNESTLPSVTRKIYSIHRHSHRTSMIRTASVLNRLSNAQHIIGDDHDKNDHHSRFALDDDTFTLMTITRCGSKSWTLGACSFIFQMTLASQILFEQIQLSDNSSTFDVPFQVTISVRLAQFLSISLGLAMQSDILTSVRAFLVMGRVNSNWVSVIGRKGERRSLVLWLIYVAFPNGLKFVQGFVVLTSCLVVIVQADDIVSLLKDFTALMVVSEIDNILFELAAYGYLGEELCRETKRIKDINIIPNINSDSSKEESLEQRSREITYIRGIFILVLSALLAIWIFVVVMQENGTYFNDKYPNCGIENFELAKKYFGDGECYGGALNTLACKFEGGDCVNFNIAYPACRGFDNLTNVEKYVGNGNCDPEFAISECDYDGGDCPL